MKKKYLIISISVLLVLSTCLYVFMSDNTNRVVISSEDGSSIVNTNALTMMYETEYQSGEYQVSSDTAWPQDGYVFNETLSRCENGGTVSWNDATNKVTMKTNISDKCYVYFDKYALPIIDKVNITKTYNSISLTVDATKGNNEIVKYYYSNNDGASYVNSTNNTYNFSNLSSNVEYKIKVYVEDSLGYKSSVYETTVTTNAYTNPSISNVTTSNITTSSITLNVTASGGTNNVKTYYYSKDNGSSYVSSTSNSYTFSGLTSGTTYNFKVYVKDSAGYSSNTKSINATTDNIILFADYIKSQGTNGLYYHTSSLANSAADNSYRYAGVDPNNYVCFGSDAATCPENNLYRIIGVFDNEVKLIKLTSYGYYAWDSNYNNTWSSSTIKSTLNTTYYNTLSATWQNKIATHTWKVGGMSWGDTSTAKQYYDVEVGNNSISTTWSGKIGLMYVSDYGFAATSKYWTLALKNYESVDNSNWIYSYYPENTLSLCSSYFGNVFVLGANGNLYYSHQTYPGVVRPVFYLNSNVTYVSGNGSYSSPFRIN